MKAVSDEFSAHPLHRSWAWDNPGGKAKYMTVKGRFVLSVGAESNMDASADHAPKILRKPMAGDWLADTHYTETTEREGGPSHAGIIIYGNERQWILWGVHGNSGLQAHAMVEPGKNAGVLEGVQSISEKHPFFRIRKRSNDAAHTRYYFYYSKDRMTWIGAGFWEDKDNIFKDARIGLAGRAWGEAYTVEFDYFTEYVPVNDIDEFNGTALDPIWTWKADEGCNYRFTGGNLANGDIVIHIAGTAEIERNIAVGQPFAATLLRRPINFFTEDWMVDTRLKRHAAPGSGAHGLTVYYDAGNWLFWGYDGHGMKIEGRIDGASLPELGQAFRQHERLRIRKTGSVFEFESSGDGILWETSGVYADEARQLAEARYGLAFGHSDKGAYEASYAFFRERHAPEGVLRDVTGLNRVNMITGPDAPDDTRRQDLHGTDLGSMVEMDGRHYFMFGDTFSEGTGNWRSNVLGYTEERDPSAGMRLTWITDEAGTAKEVIASLKAYDFNEFTSIPTNGIAHEGVLYYSYMNVAHWGPAAHWDCGFSEWCISEDRGHTWTKTSIGWGAGSHFIQLACVKDGSTLYVYGIPSSRFGGVKLAKVPIAQLLEMGAYRYYAGIGEDGDPVWSLHEKDAELIVPGPVGEFSVMFNPYLGKWIMTYLNEHTLDLEIREGDAPWSWGRIPLLLVDHTIAGCDKLVYAPFMTPAYVENNGETIYFTMSQWMPVYNVAWMKARLVRL